MRTHNQEYSPYTYYCLVLYAYLKLLYTSVNQFPILLLLTVITPLYSAMSADLLPSTRSKMLLNPDSIYCFLLSI